MTKRQLIDEIRQHNATATSSFLSQFDEHALEQYLAHLQTATQKRPQVAGWIRKQPTLRMVG